jgi:hypothetical protein
MVTRSDVNPASHNRMQTFRQSGGLVGVVACAIGFLLATTLAGCHGDLGDRLQSGQVLDWHGLQGRWAGPVVPTDPTCGSTTQGLMTIGVKNFGFDPFQGTTVIQGEVDKESVDHLRRIVLGLGNNQWHTAVGPVPLDGDPPSRMTAVGQGRPSHRALTH